MVTKLAISLLLVASLFPLLIGCSSAESADAEDSAVPKTIPSIDVSAPTETETATFALGWFWGPDSRFGSLDGVVRTRVGYAGGTEEDPTYHSLGGHSETVQIDYDPTQISYKELLDVFWDSHNPVTVWSRQYMSIVFYHNDEQRRLAIETKEREEAKSGNRIVTEIVAFSEFYLAEDYHQKYYLRQEPDIMQDLSAIYPTTEDFIASTATARLNGYAGGYGEAETLRDELSGFGLSVAGNERLKEIADKGLKPGCALP